MTAAASAPACAPVLTGGNLYLVTNETGQKELQAQFAAAAAAQQSPLKKAACGVSGLCILNLASLDPEITCIDFYDLSDRVGAFWEKCGEIICQERDRVKALSELQGMVQENRNEFFKDECLFNASRENTRLQREVNQGLSFFSDNTRYARIREIFVAKRVTTQKVDLFVRDSLQKFWAKYQEIGCTPSLVYWSNVSSQAFTMEDFHNYQHNLSAIPQGAIFVDASRMESAAPGKGLPDYCALRLSHAPNLPRVMPEQNLYKKILEEDNLPALRELANDRYPLDFSLPNSGDSFLMYVAGVNAVKCFTFLIKEVGLSAQFENPINRTTLLHTAGGPQIAELLVDAGLDINALDIEKRSPLYYAADNNRPEVVRYLLSRGALPSLFDTKGITPLTCALLEESVECTQMLLDADQITDKDIKDSFFYAQGPCLRLMLDHPKVKKLELNVNSYDKDGYTLLHIAVLERKDAEVALLLALGADPSLKTPINKKTVRELALDKGFHDIAALLADKGA